MDARPRTFMRPVPYLVALALGLGLPSPADAQQQAPTAAAASAIKDLPLTPAQRQVYIGSYTVSSPDGGKMAFRVFEEDGVLKGQPAENDAKRLLYQGEHVFHPEGHPEMTLTFTVEKQRATKFVFAVPDEGRRMEAVRSQ